MFKIWVPDTYFPESLEAFKQDVMVPNVLIRLSPEGNILYSSRVTVVTKCPMELGAFPLDSQTCILRLECYGYTAEELLLFWKIGVGSGWYYSLPIIRVLTDLNSSCLVVPEF